MESFHTHRAVPGAETALSVECLLLSSSGKRERARGIHDQAARQMSERKTEGKDHKEDDDEEDLEDPDLKVNRREHATRLFVADMMTSERG